MDKSKKILVKKLFDAVFSKKILIDIIQEFLTLKEKKIFSMTNSIINQVFAGSIKVVKFNPINNFQNGLVLNKFVNLLTLILSHKAVSIFYNGINKLSLPKLQNLILKYNDEVENYDAIINFINLESLWIEETKITNIDFIAKMKNLNNIHLIKNIKLNEKDYKILGFLPESISVSLAIKEITINDISFLYDIKNMEELVLLNNKFNVYLSMDYLKKHKNLKILALDNFNFNDYSLINEFPNLTELSLSSKLRTQIDINFSYQINLGNLRKLYLNNIEFENFSFLSKLDNLEQLSLKMYYQFILNSTLKNNNKLKILILNNVELSDYSALSFLINLEKLEMYSNKDLNVDLSLENNRKLKILKLNNILMKSLYFIRFLKNLEELSIEYSSKYPINISFNKNSQLKRLFLKNLKFTDILFLINLPDLEELKLFGINDNITSYSPLKNIKKLKILEIDNIIKYNEEDKSIRIYIYRDNDRWEKYKDIFKISLIKDIKKLILSSDCNTNDIEWKKFTQIEELILYCCPKKNIKSSNLLKLRSLSIDDINKSEINFLLKQNFSKLEEIKLMNKSNIEDSLELININSVKRIKIEGKLIDLNNNILDLSDCNLKNINFINRCENKLKNKEKVFLQKNHLKNAEPLKKLKAIKTLNLARNELENIDFLNSSNFAYLEDLNLRANIYITNFKPLSALKHIKNLNLSALFQNDISFIEFINSENLSLLDIRFNRITEITPTLKKLMGMKNLNLKLTNNYEIYFPNIRDEIIKLKGILLRDYDQFQHNEKSIILLGSMCSGKTCFLNYLDNKNFVSNTLATTGLSYREFRYFYRGGLFHVNFWDTSGSEIHRNFNKYYCQNKNGIVIFYDVTDKSSFNEIDSFIESIKNDYKEKALFIVGNKIDNYMSRYDRGISEEEGEYIAIKYNAKYFEISCKTGEGIKELENRMIIDTIESGQPYSLENVFKPSLKYKSLKKNKKDECLMF